HAGRQDQHEALGHAPDDVRRLHLLLPRSDEARSRHDQADGGDPGMNPTSLTVSLVPEAKGGPFILWDPLPVACSKAKALGYDAIEVFPPSAEGVDVALLEKSLKENGLKLAAMGTGAGAVLRKLTLTSPDAEVRRLGREFVCDVIDVAGRFGAPAILGSMQGRWGAGVDRATAVGYLRPALEEFGERAK